MEVTFFSQMSTFSRNLNHHWQCRKQKENFQTILVMTFQNFTMFQYRSDSPQVKGNFKSSIANLVYELPNDLRKMSNLSEHLAQWLVSYQELRLCKQQLKNKQIKLPNFSFPVPFYWISPFCFEYFVRDCSFLVRKLCESLENLQKLSVYGKFLNHEIRSKSL